jgi:pimeloyl-ACP methyl ester carboxylesterase/DNA-binding CsgD family transcriptional regulator
MDQQIRFCKSADGARLAYALSGEGPPLVKAPHWLTHLEHEGDNPVTGPWIKAFSREYRFVRMDERGCGLSSADAADISFQTMVADLEAVVDAAGLDRFALLGHSQGSAIAVEYAARHPERVTHLVLLGGYTRGALVRDPSPAHVAELQAQLKLIEVGWGRDDPSYRQMFATMFMPGGSLEQIQSMSEFQRLSATPQNAVRVVSSFFNIDVRAAAARVICPALVAHARRDRRVPFEEGVQLAELIASARFLPLETDNHILVEQEAAFAQFFAALADFMPGRSAATQGLDAAAFAELTARERDVLEHIARGEDNAQIAAHLALSEKTVRNHITHIFDKLGVENRPQAIVLARERGLGVGLGRR